MAKLEKPEAVEDLPAIVEAFDGLMVARGDLGVEMPLEQVPLVQKQAIRLCRQAAKPVIVATQMLDSMISDQRPTRAEVSDVANAVLDGTDAVMLSAETSVGAHPAHTVATMARIVEAAEGAAYQGAALEWGSEEGSVDARTADAVTAQLAFSWGIESAVLAPATTAETMPAELSRVLLAMGTCRPGDLVVVVSGSRSGVPGSTDSLRVLRIER